MTYARKTLISLQDTRFGGARCGADDSVYVAGLYALRPTVNAAITLKNICRDRADTPLNDLIAELGKQCDSVSANKLGRVEAMLITQAHTLDAIFNQLVIRAAMNQGEYLDVADRYYKLALRAQNQARATLETLATIKNPPNLAIVKQANIGQTVQVNNGTARASRAPENENEPNKLLEVTDGERLDVGAATAASRADSDLEAVGSGRPDPGQNRVSSAPRGTHGRAGRV